VIFRWIGQEINNLLNLSFALVKPCNVFEFYMYVFCDFKVFGFVKVTSKFLTYVLGVSAFVDESQYYNEGDNI
jgi:hypothetical protein